jgi:hypothetical protein
VDGDAPSAARFVDKCVDRPTARRLDSIVPGGAVTDHRSRDRIKALEERNGLSGRFVVRGAPVRTRVGTVRDGDDRPDLAR